MKDISKKLGIFFIVMGVLLGIVVLNMIPVTSILFIISIALIASYFLFYRHLVILIPGCLLMAVAIFIALQIAYDDFAGTFILLLLGIAFLAVFFIHNFRMETSYWGQKYWPLFPGAVLMIIGSMFIAARNGMMTFNPGYLVLITPITLIAVGVIIVLSDFKKKKKQRNREE